MEDEEFVDAIGDKVQLEEIRRKTLSQDQNYSQQSKKTDPNINFEKNRNTASCLPATVTIANLNLQATISNEFVRPLLERRYTGERTPFQTRSRNSCQFTPDPDSPEAKKLSELLRTVPKNKFPHRFDKEQRVAKELDISEFNETPKNGNITFESE